MQKYSFPNPLPTRTTTNNVFGSTSLIFGVIIVMNVVFTRCTHAMQVVPTFEVKNYRIRYAACAGLLIFKSVKRASQNHRPIRGPYGNLIGGRCRNLGGSMV